MYLAREVFLILSKKYFPGYVYISLYYSEDVSKLKMIKYRNIQNHFSDAIMFSNILWVLFSLLKKNLEM